MSDATDVRTGGAGARREMVLRAVALQPQPLRLERPARAVAATAPAPQQDPDAVPAVLQARLDARYQDGYEQGRKDGARAEREALEAGQHRAGYEQGRQEGLAEGRRAAAAQFEQGLSRIDALLRAVPEQIAARLAAAEDDMTALCFEAIVKMAGEDSIRMAVVRHVLQQAVPLHAAASLTLHVHPDDLAALKADPAFETWLARREAGSALRLAGDSSLRLGGVLLRSQHGSLDARMETQLQSLKSMLLQTRRDEPGRVPGGTANAARRGVRRAAPGAHAPLAEGEPQ